MIWHKLRQAETKTKINLKCAEVSWYKTENTKIRTKYLTKAMSDSDTDSFPARIDVSNISYLVFPYQR